VLDYGETYVGAKAGAIETSTIRGVSAGREGSLSHPPSIVLALSDGRSVEIGILAGVWSLGNSSKNTIARDEIIALVSRLLLQNGPGLKE
jgi:hypothetical protein